MCGPMDDWDFGRLGSAQLLLDAQAESSRLSRDFDHYVIISGRRWGKSRDPFNLQWPFDSTEHYGNFAPDDRPIAELVDEHFRARFERSDHAPKDFQGLYDVPGAL